MDMDKLLDLWKSEEDFPFKGWDFSHIKGRYEEEPVPWDYRGMVKSQMHPGTVMLDMGTGGGEFLISLAPQAGRTYATESYPPNIELASKNLSERGIGLRAVNDDSHLPFEDSFFNLVINRHESFCLPEIFRILKPGGTFITQQVGHLNNRDVSQLLLGEAPVLKCVPENLSAAVSEAKALGFTVLEEREDFPKSYYYDVGALVYKAKVIEWEFPGFSVDRCFDKLLELQEAVETQGYFTSMEHRYLLVLRKN
jgi:SAM-dependent methyltransferase